jgi:hypothetical protein
MVVGVALTAIGNARWLGRNGGMSDGTQVAIEFPGGDLGMR